MSTLSKYFEQRIKNLEYYYELTKVKDSHLQVKYFLSENYEARRAQQILKINSLYQSAKNNTNIIDLDDILNLSCSHNHKAKTKSNKYLPSIKKIDGADLKCAALTAHYTRCQKKVTHNYINLNDHKETFKYKYHVPLCKKHKDEILKSSTKKELYYGFYYESDLYF